MGAVDKIKRAASAAEATVAERIRREARAAVLPWVVLSVALSLVALRRRR